MHKLQITHEQLLETIQEGIWVIDADSNTTFVNPKMAEILGYAVAEMIGKNLFAFMDEEEIQNAQKKVEDKKSGLAETHGSRVKHKDGRDVYVEIKTTPVTDERGIYQGAVAGVTDITERRKAEEELKARERFLATILKTTIDGFWVVDNQKKITMVNDAYCALSGYSREELIGMTIKELDAVEVPEETAARIKRIVENGSELFQTYHRRKDGNVFPLEISITFLTENGGQMLCFCRDITERKQAEKALRESEQFLRSTLDGLSSHIAVINEDGEIVLTNKAYRDFAECNQIEHEAVSEGCNYLAVCDAAQGENSEEADIFAQGIKTVLSGARSSFELEYPCHCPEEQRWFIGRVTPCKSSGPGRLVIAHENITERKKAEESLKRQVSERAAVDAFTNSVSNDLQAPLRRIEGFSEALLEECHGELSDLARDYLRRITTQVSSMKERTDALLKLSRVVSHGIKPEEVNLSALARPSLEKLR